MRLSAKTEYACLAMLELAGQFAGGVTVRAGDIAARHGIPLQFLLQILRMLRSAGLVESVRGAGGGYRLSVPPEKVSLADVVLAIEGRAGDKPAAVESPSCQVLQAALDSASAAYRAVLEKTTLADLVEASRAADGSMYYI